MKDHFDVNLFNKIYEDNKIPESFDRGLWKVDGTKSSTRERTKRNNKMDSIKIYLIRRLMNIKRSHAYHYKQQLVKYEEPEQRLSMKNQDALVTLDEKG